jgi:hypothetical protein
MAGPQDTSAIVVERYKYILQQIHTLNENIYRFFGIFQTLVTAIVTALLVLFVGYSKWGIAPDTARTGVRGLLVLASVTAGFTILLIVVGVLSWLDYRREECELTAEYFQPGFRSSPKLRNFYRWYETYVVIFIIAAIALLWVLSEKLIIPQMS